jgi:hypothetical protein
VLCTSQESRSNWGGPHLQRRRYRSREFDGGAPLRAIFEKWGFLPITSPQSVGPHARRSQATLHPFTAQLPAALLPTSRKSREAGHPLFFCANNPTKDVILPAQMWATRQSTGLCHCPSNAGDYHRQIILLFA